MPTNDPQTGRRDPAMEPDPSAASSGQVGGTDADPARRDLRAEIGKYVSLAEFPTSARGIVSAAESNGAPASVLEHLRGLAGDTTFDTPRDLWIALDLEATDRF